MKILYLAMDPGIHVLDHSGAAVHIRAFIAALSDLGHDVTLVCTALDGGPAVDGIRIHPAPLQGANRAAARLLRALNRMAGRAGRENPDVVRIAHNLAFRKAILACARESAPDLLYERYSLWGAAGLQVAKRLGIPHALEVNAPLAYEQQRYRGLTFPRLARYTERRVWRGADLVLPVSAPLRAHLEQAGVPAEKILVLPNAVDHRLFHPRVDGSGIRTALNLEDRFVIGLACTFKPWHGADLLLEAFEKIHAADPRACLLLVGDGPGRPALERRVRLAGLSGAVVFTGAIPHERMPAYLAALDIAVATYPPLEEQYYSPLKLFEYMAAGRAIIASRGGQAGHFLADGITGLLVEPGDPGGLAECIFRLRSDRALRSRLGQRAWEASTAFTWHGNATRCLERLQHRCVSAFASPYGQEKSLV